jgi:16S rRNA (adenine1518-N6/adenine1519-N6)-dimethyltransferase
MEPINVKRLLRQFGLRPSKKLGQHFLIDQSAIKRVMAAADLSETDCVLEVGPGLGNLTQYLAETVSQVIAVEIDSSIIPALEFVLQGYENVRVIHGDILKVDLNTVIDHPGYVVVANIPYYITSVLIRHLLEAQQTPSRMVLTVQKEVALRICALPGKMSLLSLSVQVYGGPRIMGRISPEAFYPPPRIESSVVRVDLYPQPVIPIRYLDTFFKLAKAGFSQKRKTLRNALIGGTGWSKEYVEDLLKEAGIDPVRRAQTLSVEEWGELAARKRLK